MAREVARNLYAVTTPGEGEGGEWWGKSKMRGSDRTKAGDGGSRPTR